MVKLYPVEFNIDNEEATRYYVEDVIQMDSKTHVEKTIYADSFRVSALDSPDLSINVSTGQCSFEGKFLASDTTENIKITANTTTFNRYDLIVADMSTGEIKALRGQPSANPTIPTANRNQILLAKILVGSQVLSIQQSNIEDLRFKTKEQYNIEALDRTVFNILSKLQDKLEIVVSETLPAIAERKQNTIYCKITDKVNSGTGGNVTIRVSPNLGIKV
ncbi:putative tail fiber-related protein [Clostridium sp. CAG:221]|jgi:hypothetical protein|uniref:hypothetical protein n=1 Tax=Clostridium sp. CAG:221 TaxID=1262780 RepID=UPI00033652BE|nr:hypothetical protein [Clostridium sp. CAG:221]CDB16186.1 putative tail fiber-related protein [Clostridium sp. CAG:221]